MVSIRRGPQIGPLHVVLAFTPSGEPSAITAPRCSTVIMCARRNTTSMSCSTSSTVTCSSDSSPAKCFHRLYGLLHRQALRRLVQQQQAGLLRECHRHFQQTLVAVRQQPRRPRRNWVNPSRSSAASPRRSASPNTLPPP